MHAFNHNGQPPDPDDVFFAGPPAIGEIRSATTKLRRGQWWRCWSPMRLVRAATAFLLGGVIALGLGLLVAYGLDRMDAPLGWIGVTGGLAAAGWSLWRTRWFDRCSYVGSEGIAEYTRRRGRIGERVLRFEQAHAIDKLELSLRDLYYRAVWYDDAGRRLFVIEGSTYTSGHWRCDRVHFFWRAVEAWEDWRQRRPAGMGG